MAFAPDLPPFLLLLKTLITENVVPEYPEAFEKALGDNSKALSKSSLSSEEKASVGLLTMARLVLDILLRFSFLFASWKEFYSQESKKSSKTFYTLMVSPYQVEDAHFKQAFFDTQIKNGHFKYEGMARSLLQFPSSFDKDDPPLAFLNLKTMAHFQKMYEVLSGRSFWGSPRYRDLKMHPIFLLMRARFCLITQEKDAYTLSRLLGSSAVPLKFFSDLKTAYPCPPGIFDGISRPFFSPPPRALSQLSQPASSLTRFCSCFDKKTTMGEADERQPLRRS